MARAAAPVAQEQIPDAVASLAAAHELGQHRETFLPQRMGTGRMAGLILFTVLGLACFILPGLVFVRILMQTPNLSGKQAAKRIHLFEHGLIVADHTGPAAAFRWDSMTALQQITERYANGVYVGTSYLYTLFRPDGSTLKLTNFYADPDRWGTAIQHEITQAQLPGVIASLEQGATVRFGDIAMTKGGIATAKRGAVQWNEIQKIEVKNGTVFLAKAGKLLSWSNTPVAKIPNFFLFLTIVDHLRNGSGYGRN
ncbi:MULTISPECIES: DUF6585 family protein [unclassified Streptomyces]|uniref:DUF6585 family protein n=1 Tax=unclassified Streptomyces TaxID=2593676 RepID=UPI001BEC5F9F|nr:MULTISPECIES: DUF6585 family protein [unclassified Streptomyces]MBT2407113.1 hypothetical protein [Streptomyces sp. ISL-21]MBT2455889.1 hypothetical protein [Streptomyces sp. ISL-86]MBT2613187.1 hypothetical protein [Streptomyces sp. ISL-87]